MGAGSPSTGNFADEVTMLRAILREAGHDPEVFPMGKRVYTAIDHDCPRAGKRLADWFGAFYGRPRCGRGLGVGLA